MTAIVDSTTEEPKAGPARRERSEPVDAVRGLAILLVVSFHWFGMPFGWTGVDLFFVLSGYLIGGILIDNRESPDYFRTFYVRRAFRIVPLYVIFLLVVTATYGTDLPVWRYLTFTQNFVWAHTGLAQAGPAGLTWSLAVEEQFYLVLPLLIRISSIRMLMCLSVFLVGFAPICRWLLIVMDGAQPYVMLPGRMDALFAGVIVACAVRHPVILNIIKIHIGGVQIISGVSFAGFVVLGLMVGFSTGSVPMYLVGYSLLALSYGCGLLAIVARERRIVKHKLLSATGVRAYSIYLFHQIVLSEVLSMVGWATSAAYLIALVMTAALSMACWILIERPFLRYARTRWPKDALDPHPVPFPG